MEIEEFKEPAEITGCTGYDPVAKALMVPEGGSNKVTLKISGASQALLNKMTFKSSMPGNVTISPETPISEEQVLTVSGLTAQRDVSVQVEIEGTTVDLFEVDVLRRVTKTIHVINVTEENDDVAGDDPTTCVLAGANGFVDTKPGGDDVVFKGDGVNIGANQNCESTPNDTNIPPIVYPDNDALQSFLHRIWLQQANVELNVTGESDVTFNYDLNRSGLLDTGPFFGEYNELDKIPDGQNADFRIYVVDDIDGAHGFAVSNDENAFIGRADFSLFLLTSHELGHLVLDIGGNGHLDHLNDLVMHTQIAVHKGCLVDQQTWRAVK